MSTNKLFKTWGLISAPFECRLSILKGICFRFNENGLCLVGDTANSSNGTYEMSIETDTENRVSGKIKVKSGGWTERARMWETSEEKKEAKLVDEFIHKVIRNPFKFELEDNILNVYYDDEKYQFSARV